MRLRVKSRTTIEYILVANGSPMISPILPPEAFDNEVINFIRRCPLDLAQLMDSLNYLEVFLKNVFQCGYDLHVFNIEDYSVVEHFIKESKQIQLLFLDESNASHIALYEELKAINTISRYFYFYNRAENSIRDKNVIFAASQFILTLIEDQKDILAFLNASTFNINPSVSIEYRDFNEFLYFIPTRNNYFLLNRIIGNFGDTSSSLSEEDKIAMATEETQKAQKNKNSFDRQDDFIPQIKKIDYFFHISYREGILKPASGLEPFLPPLIFVLPFHNPDLKEIYSNESIVKLLQVEQSANYINDVKFDSEPRLVLSGMNILKDRINYLDDVSFLHSSFTFSPVIRLPIKGKSIYRELSFFRPEFFLNLSLSKNRRKLKKTITNFGKVLRNQTISSKIEKLIKNRNGQIVIISDIPVEWTLIDGIPFSFTHDITRLPETSLHGLMSFYTNNQMFEFSISPTIIKKTLVILGAYDKSFLKWHEFALELSERDGFSAVKCNCLNDVKQAVTKFKPDFLIFDCHGGYDKTSRSSYLKIGEDTLDGNYVVRNEISAPLIFLSACGTAPTYGTMNPIANAFFEAGAISVTSTFLPISIDSGSILYLRILNKLNYAANNVIHKNWLEFISHLIRTSSMNEAYSLALKKKKRINSSEFFDSNVHALTDSLVFSKRRELFASMDKKISALTNDSKLYYSEVIPEYLLYTNLGRGDLVLFDNWKDEFVKKNVC